MVKLYYCTCKIIEIVLCNVYRFAEKRLRLIQKQYEKEIISNTFDKRLSNARLIENKVSCRYYPSFNSLAQIV